MAEYVRITGLRELQVQLMALPGEIVSKNGGPVLKALRKMGMLVQSKARARVRRRTGTLAENIIVTRARDPRARGATEEVDVTVRFKAKKKVDNKKNRRAGKVGETYKDYGALFYARFLEFGTEKMPAYPFMRPAFDEARAELPGIFKRELAQAIDLAVLRARKAR